jgi:hypothetical protein
MSDVFYYRVCDSVIETRMAFPELTSIQSAAPQCRFDLLPKGDLLSGEFDWFHSWRPGDGRASKPWLQFVHYNGGYLLRFPEYAEFLVRSDSRHAECRPLPGTARSTIRHLFLDQVLPLMLSRRERAILHASAVATPFGAAAFCGPSGSGKSTLAMALIKRGGSLISDDCLVLREQSGAWHAVPSYPGVRLWPSATKELLDDGPATYEIAEYTSKRRVAGARVLSFAGAPVRLRALFFLSGEDTRRVAIVPLTPKEAFMRVVEFAYNLDITDKGFLRSQFEVIGTLVSQIQCLGLDYPRDFSKLPMVCQSILTRLKEMSNDTFSKHQLLDTGRSRESRTRR